MKTNRKIGKVFFVFAGVSLACLSITHFILGAWIPFFWILLAFFVLFTSIGIYIERRNLADFFTMKTTKHGMNMGVTILLVLVTLGLANFISSRQYKTWDFSSAQANSLSEQSISLVKSLEEDLSVKYFYREGQEGVQQNRQAFRELVKKYQDHSSRVKLEFIEVNQRPDLTSDYGVNKGSGLAFIDYKGKRNRIEKIEEQEFTSALVKVTREQDKNIYFITGHGEKDLEEAKEGSGLNALKVMLENNRYVVHTLSLNTKPEIPENADVVMIVAPQQEFMDYEISALEAYLARGGSLFVALESRRTSVLEKFLFRLGIVPEMNYVLNLITVPGLGKALRQGPTFGSEFSDADDITKVFGKNQTVQFLFPMSFVRGEIPPGIMINDIVKTNADAASFKELKDAETGKATRDGSFTLGMHAFGPFPKKAEASKDQASKDANEAAAKDFSLVVFGDADFLTNQVLYQALNRDLFLNAIASLANEKNMISISPKEHQVTSMVLTTGSQATMGILILGLPLMFVVISILMWLRRRFY